MSVKRLLSAIYFNTILDRSIYASSVRASVNRRGKWDNLDYYQELARGSRKQIVKQIEPLQQEIITLIDNMLFQDDLQPTHALLKQLKYITDKRLSEIYQLAYSEGRAVYEVDLQKASKFWGELKSEWGKGSGYKKRISDKSERWFRDRRYQDYEQQVTKSVAEKWSDYVNEIKRLVDSDLET